MKECTNKKIGQLIASYELGLLNEREKTRFENHALECPHCLEELERLYPKLKTLYENRQEILSALQPRDIDITDLEIELPLEFSEPKKTKVFKLIWGRRRNRMLVPAFGLAVVVALCLVLIHKPGGEQNPYLPYLSFKKAPYLSIAETRVSQTTTEKFFDDGMQSYKNDNFNSAIGNLKKAAELDSNKTKTWLYLGISHYLNHQPIPAIEALQKAEEIADPVQKNMAYWYRAQAYLLLEDPALSIPLLKNLADQGLEYSDEAKDLLVKIREISPVSFN